MRWVAWILACSALAGCAAKAIVSGRYTGPVPACARGEGTQATLARTGDAFAFAPTDGALIIRGKIAPGGAVSGVLAPRASGDAAGKRTGSAPLLITLGGHIDDDAATLAYAVAGCNSAVTLRRVRPPLL